MLERLAIFCIMRENWPYPPTASGSYSRQAGRWTGSQGGGQAARGVGRQAGRWVGRRVGRQAGRQAGGRAGSRQADKIRVSLEFFKILYRLNYSGFYFVYYHCNVTTVLYRTTFQSAFVK